MYDVRMNNSENAALKKSVTFVKSVFLENFLILLPRSSDFNKRKSTLLYLDCVNSHYRCRLWHR